MYQLKINNIFMDPGSQKTFTIIIFYRNVQKI